MKVETQNLITVKSYARKWDITKSYVYKLIQSEDIKSISIDGVYFIDIVKYPKTPKTK